MTTVLEDADEGSSRASCVFMARSYPGQVLVRNPSAKSVHISASYARLSQKTGHVLVRTPGTRKPGFQPQKRAMSGGLNLPRCAGNRCAAEGTRSADASRKARLRLAAVSLQHRSARGGNDPLDRRRCHLG